MRSRLVLGLWILALLFPAVALRKVSSAYRLAFDRVFDPEWVHVVMHLLLYAGLGILLVAAFRLGSSWRTWLALAAVALLIGSAQEILQWLSLGETRSLGWMVQLSGFDLVVDALGISLGMGAGLRLRKLTRAPKHCTRRLG
jgi:hypothetical protein